MGSFIHCCQVVAHHPTVKRLHADHSTTCQKLGTNVIKCSGAAMPCIMHSSHTRPGSSSIYVQFELRPVYTVSHLPYGGFLLVTHQVTLAAAAEFNFLWTTGLIAQHRDTMRYAIHTCYTCSYEAPGAL